MANSVNPDPRAGGLAGSGAVAREPELEAVNLGLGVALLRDGRFVPITNGYDRDGEDCGLDSSDLYSFICGADGIGWWDCLACDWVVGIRVH